MSTLLSFTDFNDKGIKWKLRACSFQSCMNHYYTQGFSCLKLQLFWNKHFFLSVALAISNGYLCLRTETYSWKMGSRYANYEHDQYNGTEIISKNWTLRANEEFPSLIPIACHSSRWALPQTAVRLLGSDHRRGHLLPQRIVGRCQPRFRRGQNEGRRVVVLHIWKVSASGWI